jgi:hypothetical protein
VDRAAAFTLDAVAGSSRVAVDGLAIAATHEDSERGGLADPVHGGGPLLRLRTGGGRIELAGR